MKLLDARFVTSASDARAIPVDGIPHIALVGRSNVGKSTLINALARRPLARTSARPGKTRLVNLYRFAIDGGPGGPGRWDLWLADLPGYGYASTGRRSSADMGQVARSYFSGMDRVARGPSPAEIAQLKLRATRDRYVIAGVLHLVDARHPGLESDAAATGWLASLEVERALVATKIDKLSRSDRVRNVVELERKLGMAALPISARDGEGMDDLWRLIARLSRQR